MNKELLREDLFIQKCPIRNVLSRLCDRWSMLIIYSLENEPVMRFGELMKLIPDISQKMLTSTLRKLEEDGMVNRKVYAQIPPKVEYSLSDRGRSVVPHLNALIQWAKDEMGGVMEDRRKYQSENQVKTQA